MELEWQYKGLKRSSVEVLEKYEQREGSSMHRI